MRSLKQLQTSWCPLTTVYTEEEKVKTIVGRIICERLNVTYIEHAISLMSELWIMAHPLASYSRTHKSIWDYYNEMAIGEDASRETEWGELAETILLFVNNACCS